VVKLRSSLNALAAASLLALVLTTLPAGVVHAAPNSPKPSAKQDCINRGYRWMEGQGCADKTCRQGGTVFRHPAEPGETRYIRNSDGTVTTQYCDGVTGTWITLGIQPGTSAPPPPPPPTASQ